MQTQPSGGNDPTYPFNVSGSKAAASTFPGSVAFSGVAIAGPDAANGETGQVTWTTPAAAATAQNYSIIVNFDADTTINESPATVTINFSIAAAPSDSTPPTIQANVVPAPNADGWNNSTPVNLTWTITDPDSATSIVSGCVNETFTSETSGETRSCTASSVGGTTGPVSVTIKIDKTKPVIAGSTGSYTPGTWTNQDVVVSFTCADAGTVQSGIKTDTVAGVTVSASGANQSVTNTGTCLDRADNAGNSTTVTDIDIDKIAPMVACNAASFLLNQPGAVVTATVSDGLSGPLSVTANSSADTSSVGSKTVSITGYDNAGNSTTVSCPYTVGYRFDGLYAPVDRPNTLNVSKAGQAIPLKWRLTDYNNDPVTILATVVVSVSNVSCALGTSDDLVEELASGSSGLQNLGDGYYQFNWKTPTSYAGSCKSLNLKLGDEVIRTGLAYFSFKK